MHKSQIFFFLLLVFVAGILIASLIPVSPEAVLVLLIAGTGTLALSAYQNTYSRKGIMAGFFIIAFTVGAARFVYFDLSGNILPQLADRQAKGVGVPVILRGYINGEPNITAKTTRFNFRAKEIVFPDWTLPVDETTVVTANGAVFYDIGQALLVEGAVSTPKNFEDGFDYINYLKKDGIKTVVLFPKISETEGIKIGFLENRMLNFKEAAFTVKSYFERSVNKAMVEPNASYINGILLGSRQNIPEDLKEAFNKTGTTHILAISGYNIMIIASALLVGLVFFVKRRVAFWISVAVIFAFTVMTGSSASVVRASLMGLLLIFAQGYGRMYSVRNSIVLAGAAMVFVNPFVLVFDIGFQLSFLAVLGLVYFYPMLKKKLEKTPGMFGIKESFVATVSAQAFVGIPIILYFGRFSWTFLPANILILPLVPFAMFFGLIAGLGQMLLPALGQVIAIPAWAITSYQIKVIELLAGI